MSSGKQPKSQKKVAPKYGIGEWFGKVVADISRDQREQLLELSRTDVEERQTVCPFVQEAFPKSTCFKQSGVCSIRLYEQSDLAVTQSGNFVSLCPARFWQDNEVFRWVGQTILGTSTPLVISEVAFLARQKDSKSPQKEGRESKPVGKIDGVLVDPKNSKNWCALEFQAVYFSGEKMSTHLEQFLEVQTGTLPFPDKRRGPDFRSSAPKRLMPQLQIKVPTLRRWARKMAVVIDEDFFSSFAGSLREEKEISNCDIVWFVVDFDHDSLQIKLSRTAFSTLEASVEALAGGIPRAESEFQKDLEAALSLVGKAGSRKTIVVKSK